jgi:hypothetical protein
VEVRVGGGLSLLVVDAPASTNLNVPRERDRLFATDPKNISSKQSSGVPSLLAGAQFLTLSAADEAIVTAEVIQISMKSAAGSIDELPHGCATTRSGDHCGSVCPNEHFAIT